jgi:hypothetical protein
MTTPALSRNPLVVAGTAALMLFVSPLGAVAQSEISAEVGASSVAPPLGIEGESARFFVAGLRALHFSPAGSGILGSFLVGTSLEETSGGDFLSGSLEATVQRHFGTGWSAGLESKAFGFRVDDPFPYRSFGVEGGPTLRYARRFVSATVKGLAGGAWSETTLERTGRFPAEVVTDELWRYGATGEILAGGRSVLAGLAVGVHESTGGTYRSYGLRLLAVPRGSAVELRVDRWQTPGGTETTGGVAVVVPLGGWSFRGFLGRTEPDPLTLAEPGGGTGGVLVGRRLVGRDALPAPRPPLHRVLDRSLQGAAVEIYVEAPPGTGRMEVMGDFTFWEPVPMERDGSNWAVRLEIPPGTHHFGFLADGEWFLPADAPDAVSDDWGRKNATMVIES